MNGFLRGILSFIGMPTKTVVDLDKSLAADDRLVKLAQQAAPIIRRIAPHYIAIKPDLIQLIALAEKALPDIENVLPVADELIDFAKDNK